MPIVDASGTEVFVKPTTPVEGLRKAQQPDARTLFDAAIATSSPVISALQQNTRQSIVDNINSAFFPTPSQREDGFNPYSAALKAGITDIQNYGSAISRINSQKQFDEWYADFQEMRQNKEVIAQSGIAGFGASLAAGIIDPINWIPIGAGYSSAKAGQNVLRSSLAAARVGAVAGVINEAAMTAQDASRTLEESGANIAATTLLAGAIGGGVGIWNAARQNGMTKFSSFSDMADQFDKDLVMIDNHATNADYAAYGSAGAMFNQGKAIKIDGEDVNISNIVKYGGGVKASNPVFNFLEKTLPNISATSITRNSTIPQVRALGRMLFGDSLQQEAGFINPAKTLKNQSAVYHAQMIGHLDSVAKEAEAFAKSNPDYPFDQNQFYRDLFDRGMTGQSPEQPVGASLADTEYLAMIDRLGQRQFDMMQNYGKKIEAVQQAKRKFEIKKMKEAGVVVDEATYVLPDEIDQPGYFLPSFIDRDFVINNRADFERVVLDEFRSRRAQEIGSRIQAGKKVSRAERLFFKSQTDTSVPVTGNDEALIGEYAQSLESDARYFIDDVIMGKRSGYDKEMFGAGKPSSLRQKDFFNNPETLRRFLPFMNKNFNELNWNYARKVGAYLADAEVFGPSGFKGLFQDVFGNAGSMDKGLVRDEVAFLEPSQVEEYMRSRKGEADALLAQYKMLMGTFDTDASNPMNLNAEQREFLDAVRSFNVVLKMGMSGASSVGEVATSSIAHGIKFWAGSALPKLIETTSAALNKLPLTERNLIAGALHGAKNRILYNIQNMSESEFAKGKAAQSLNKAASVVYRYSGLSLINDIAANIGLDVSIQRMKSIQSADIVTTKDADWLSLIGLTPDDLRGVDLDGDNFGRKVTAGLRNAVYSVSLNGSPEYMPAFANTPMGSVMFQFKSFLFSANNNLLLRGAQKADADVATGAMAIVGLSMMSQMIRDAARLKERKMTVQDLLYSGVSNSGLLGMPGFVIDTLGIPSILGLRPTLGKYTREGIAGQVFGPSVSNLETLAAGSELLQPGAQKDRAENARAFVNGIIPVAPLDTPFKDYLADVIK